MLNITSWTKPLWLFAAVACIAALVPTAAAQEQKERVGVYTTTTFGQAKISDDYCDGISDCEDTELFVNILVGFQFNQYAAAEFGYGATSGFDIKNANGVTVANSEYSTFSLGTQVAYPVTPDFSVFGRLGMHRWTQEINSAVGDIEGDDTDPYFGVGAEYAFDGVFDEGSLVIGANYTRYKGDGIDMDTYGASIKFLHQF